MAKGQQCVLSKHSYFHRVAKMLSEFGLHEEAAKCFGVYENILQQAGIGIK